MNPGSDPPHPRGLVEQFGDKRRIDALAAIIGNKVEAHEVNSERHNIKAVAWYWGLGLLAVALIALGAAVLSAL